MTNYGLLWWIDIHSLRLNIHSSRIDVHLWHLNVSLSQIDVNSSYLNINLSWMDVNLWHRNINSSWILTKTLEIIKDMAKWRPPATRLHGDNSPAIHGWVKRHHPWSVLQGTKGSSAVPGGTWKKCGQQIPAINGWAIFSGENAVDRISRRAYRCRHETNRLQTNLAYLDVRSHDMAPQTHISLFRWLMLAVPLLAFLGTHIFNRVWPDYRSSASFVFFVTFGLAAISWSIFRCWVIVARCPKCGGRMKFDGGKYRPSKYTCKSCGHLEVYPKWDLTAW